MESASVLIFQVAMGIGLASCAGLRAFLPLFVVGAAGKMELVKLGAGFEWLASWPSLTVFGVAVLAEILADKFPLVDNALDLFAGFVKPVAGALLAASVYADFTPLQATALGIILGGGAAGTVHLAKAKVRLVSSASTAGIGNPILSVSEDAASLFGSIAAILVPVLVVLVVATSLILLLLAARRFRRRAAHFEAPP
jgi:hypothetical protein